MRSVNIRSLATTTKASRHVWGIILIPLLLAAFPFGYAQQTTTPKTLKGMDYLDLPYLSDKSAAEKIASAPAGFITEVSTSQEGKNLVVAVNSSCQPSFQEFDLSNPARLVVDFLNVENRASVLNYPIGSAGVKQLRVRQFQSVDPKIARLVFDLDKGYGNHEITAGSQGVRIVFHPADSSTASHKGEARSSKACRATYSSSASSGRESIPGRLLGTSPDPGFGEYLARGFLPPHVRGRRP
jgi:hypothetical protein